MRVVAIFDNGGKSHDRYTIITDDKHSDSLLSALGLSENPDDANGFSQWTGALYDAKAMADNHHLGRKIRFETLTESVQRHIARRVLMEDKTNDLS